MTDSRSRPDVVHRPYHGLAALQDLEDATKRQHTLVDPMQVDDVGLAELGCPRDVYATIGDVELEQMTLGEMQVEENDQPLPEEVPIMMPAAFKPDDRQRIGLLVAHQHLRFHTVVVQRLHQAAGSHRSPACPLARIDYKYSHAAKLQRIVDK